MKNYNKKLIHNLYDSNDLGNHPFFQGGYINFGYWKDIDIKKTITKEERIQSSIALYDLIFDHLNIQNEDEILEIGCGWGYGCSRLIDRFKPSKIIGIDITPKQIERAKQLQARYCKHPHNLTFEVSSADSTSFPDGHFNKIFAVESAQHIPSIPKFAQEAWRILKPGGIAIITAHFSTSLLGFSNNRVNLPLIDQGIDLLIPIEMIQNSFSEHGFHVIDLQRIGENVFWGMDKWSSQVMDAPWAGNFLKMFKEGNLEYYVLTLKKKG